MRAEEQTQIIQALIRIIDRNKGMASFQLARIIFKEIIDPCVEGEKALWQKLFYANSSKDTPH